MKKNLLKIIAAIGAVSMLMFFYCVFCGNIFDSIEAKKEITEYISENYPDENYEISSASYDFKMKDYTCQIIDPNSEDRSFTATYSSDGSITDTYDCIDDMTNTLSRLNNALYDATEPILRKYIRGSEYIYCRLKDFEVLDTSRLYLDMPCDPKNMEVETELIAWLDSNPDKAFKRLKKIAKELQNKGYRIDYYSFFLDYGDEFDQYSLVPKEKLLNAQSMSDLKDYISQDMD